MMPRRARALEPSRRAAVTGRESGTCLQMHPTQPFLRPSGRLLTLYYLITAIQDVVGPEDDGLVVATVRHLLRSGRLRGHGTGIRRCPPPPLETGWRHILTGGGQTLERGGIPVALRPESRRIRGDGWTIQQLDSQQDTWRSATIRLILDGLTYMTKLDAVRVRGPAARPSVSERRGGLANEEPWRPNLQPGRRREHRSLQCG